MRGAFIRKGNGYAGCTAFDGFEVIAEPLATRESRVYRRATGNGTDYGSHSIKLAVEAGARAYEGGRNLFILMENGSGREVLAIGQFYDGGAYERALLAMPEPLLYTALYMLWDVASGTARQARDATAESYQRAFVEKRLKAKRRKGRVTVEIAPWFSAIADGEEIPGRFASTDEAFRAAREAKPGAEKISAAGCY